MILKENLPYPLVHYTDMYGNFIGFQKDKNSEVVLCSCMRKAVENCIKLFLKYPSNLLNPSEWILLKQLDMPESINEVIRKKNPAVGLEWLNHIKFKEDVCHRCNIEKPTKEYCTPMYGTKFKRTFGWYININYFNKGINPSTYDGIYYLKEDGPIEIRSILDPTNKDLLEDIRRYKLLDTFEDKEILEMLKKIEHREEAILLRHFYVEDKELIYKKLYYAIDYIMKQRLKEVHKIIENEVRDWFKSKRVGEKWENETRLYKIIRKLYPELTMYRHFRPPFLDGLELDIYIETLDVGIEYQGEQHFKPFKHWGGKEAFKKRQELDKKKKELCNKNKIKLIYFDYDEEINEEHIRKKLLKELNI